MIFGEEKGSLEEPPAPTDTFTDTRRGGGLSQPWTWDMRNLNIKKTTGEGLGWVLLYVFLSCKKSLSCTCFCFPDLRLEEPSVPAGRADKDQKAKTSLCQTSSEEMGETPWWSPRGRGMSASQALGQQWGISGEVR